MSFRLSAVDILVREDFTYVSLQNGQTLQLSSVLLLSLLQASFCFTKEELNELHVTLKAKGDCSTQVFDFNNLY